MKKRLFTTRKLVYTAVLSALAIVMTMAVNIPIGQNGYVNIGDSIIFLASYILGPLCGMAVGGMTFLSDIILGYAIYAPFTVVIKMLEGFIAGIIFIGIKKIKNKAAAMLLSILGLMTAGAVMMTGYFVTDIILTKTMAIAVLGLVPNIIQASISTGISFILIFIINVPKLIPADNTIQNKEKEK